ncbi:MAG TPA: NYN domain-containing protein [Candidatus Omnitrophota bacterium]|nr:NYN domain-containing protein [Candidatus Omnitrophota bacterium]
MKYILDGYNVIHKVPRLAGLLSRSLQEAREELVRLMSEWRQSRGAEVVIVFDRNKGSLDGVPVRSSRKVNGVTCVFSAPGIEADDEIIAMIRREKVPANVRVVTGDGQILNHCKALGVGTELPSRMFDQTPPKTGKTVASGNSKQLSPARENDITRWYKKQIGLCA